MWEPWNHKKGWVVRNTCLLTGAEEDSWEYLDCKIKPVNIKENQPWIFIGRTDDEVETPIFWLPDAKNWLIGKDLDARKNWKQEEMGMPEDEMVGWHHQLDGHEFEQVLGVGRIDREALYATVQRVTKTRARLSDWTELNWTISDVEHIFILLAIYMSFLEKSLLRSSTHFLIEQKIFWYWATWVCVYFGD